MCGVVVEMLLVDVWRCVGDVTGRCKAFCRRCYWEICGIVVEMLLVDVWRCGGDVTGRCVALWWRCYW